MAGHLRTIKTVKKCDSVKTNHDLLNNTWLNEKNLPQFVKDHPNELAWPCGKIAKYMFNDTFIKIHAKDGTLDIKINDTDIAH